MKKILSLFLVLIIVYQSILSVSASSTVVSNAKAPDYDIWMAETLIQGLKGKGGLYKTFRGLQEPVYKLLGEELLDDKALVSLSSSWSIFFNSEYRNHFTNEQKYIYEIILMDYLKYVSTRESLDDELFEDEFKFMKKLYSSLSENLNNKDFDELSKRLSVDKAKEILKDAKVIDGIDKALDEVEDGQETVETLIDEISRYFVLRETKENVIVLLKESQSAAGNNVDYKKAVDDILNALKSTNIKYVQGRSVEYLWNQVLDEAWDCLVDSNPILKSVELGIAGLDACFDTTNSASNNLKLALLYTIDCYMFIGMSNANQDFMLDQSALNGKKSKECFEAYIQFQMFGNEFAKGWLGQYLSGGVIKDLFNSFFQKENIKTAKELEARCQNQIKNRESLLVNVIKLSNIYKETYPITTQISIPASIKLNKTSVTLKVGESLTLKTKITGNSKAIMWKSSNTKVATVNSKGVVTAKEKGQATILAKANGVTAKCNVIVNDVTGSNWYQQVLKSVNGIYKVKNISGKIVTVYRKNYPYYKLIDINKDGIKELILSTTENYYYSSKDSLLILTYNNNKILPLININSAGGGYLTYKGKYICHYHRIADYDWYDIYELKSGNLKLIGNLSKFDGFFSTGGKLTRKEIFYKNDVKCSESIYNAYLKKYYAGGKKISYSNIF